MPSERSTEGSRVKLGRYELVKELAGTGVASSWIARLGDDEGPNPRLFSIVRLHKHVTKNVDGVEALLSEARRAQKVKDSHVVGVVETGVSDGEIFVVTEHAEAESLGTLVQQSGAAGLPAAVALRVVSDLLHAIVAAQDLPEPVAHGEIHPHYVMVGVDGVTRLSGFGLAGGLARLGNHGLKNIDRLGYAAPERVKAMASPASAASAPADARADMFSVGVVLWELLAKQRLFPSKIEAAVIQKVLTAPIPALSSIAGVDVPAPIDELVQRLLDRDPAKRPEKASEVIAVLEGAALASADEVKALVEKLAGKALGTKRTELESALKTPSVPPPPRGPSAPRPRAATLLGIPPGGIPLPGAVPSEDKPRPAGTPRPAPIREKVEAKPDEASKPGDAPKPAAKAPSTLGAPKPAAVPADKPSAPANGKRPRASTLLGVMPAAGTAPARDEAGSGGDDVDVDIEDPSTIDAVPEQAAASIAAASAPAKRPAMPPKRPPAPAKPSAKPAPAIKRVPAESAPEIEDWDTVTGVTDPTAVMPPKKPEVPAVAVDPAKPGQGAPSPVLDSVPPTRVQAVVPTDADKPEPRAAAKPEPAEAPQRGSDSSSGSGKPRGVAGAQIDRIRPGITLGRYEILMPVAKGGMASVWAARIHGTRGFQKIVALKTMLPDVSDDPDFETMFLDEARVAARIRHPNVAEILDLGEQENILYIVMEWVEGETLGKLQKAAKAVGGFPVPILLRIASQCCAGLHAAHELRDDSGNLVDLVHRDISPANVLLSTSGYVKLVDFGIAKSKARLHVTQVGGMVKGKTPYLSPEQLGGLQVDRRSDLFSLGALLYVLATGLHPFRGDTEIKTIENIALRAPIPPRQIASSLPEEFEKIVLKALEKDPANRYQTASEMQRAIDSLASSLGEPVTDDDVAAFVREVIGEAQAERAAELKAAILAVDAATEAQRQPSSPAEDESGALPPWEVDAAAPAPSDAALETGDSDASRSAGAEPGLDDDDALAVPPELARRRQMLKLAVGGVVAGLAILGVLAVAMRGGDKPGPASVESTTAAATATPAPSVTETAAAPAATEAPTAAASAAETAAPTAEPSATAEAAAPSAAPSTEPAAAKTEPTSEPHKTTHSAPVHTSHPTHTGGTKSSHPKKYNPKGI